MDVTNLTCGFALMCELLSPAIGEKPVACVQDKPVVMHISSTEGKENASYRVDYDKTGWAKGIRTLKASPTFSSW